MEHEKAPVSIWKYRKANSCMQACLREGNMEEAKKWAHTLLSYLTEMGLLDEPRRQAVNNSHRDISNGMVSERKAQMRYTT